MKVALLISGRASRYEVCLLPFILSNLDKYDFSLFMSINDNAPLKKGAGTSDNAPLKKGDNEYQYYITMKEKLKKWIKDIEIEKYIIPENFKKKFKPENKLSLQLIGEKWLPYNCLSMLYNDNKAYNMMIKYEKENNIKYDIVMKFRSDILNFKLPNLPISEKLHLYSCVPLCHFPTKGIHQTLCISDAIAWGNRETMKIYCNCYNFVLKKSEEMDGDYYISFEDCITDNIVENKVPYSFHKLDYHLDVNRRIFDKTWQGREGERKDSRQIQISGALAPLNIEDTITTENIKVIAQE